MPTGTEICAEAHAVDFWGGIWHGTRSARRAAGALRGICSAFLRIASGPVEARAHVN